MSLSQLQGADNTLKYARFVALLLNLRKGVIQDEVDGFNGDGSTLLADSRSSRLGFAAGDFGRTNPCCTDSRVPWVYVARAGVYEIPASEMPGEQGSLAEIGAKLSNTLSDVWAMVTEFDLTWS